MSYEAAGLWIAVASLLASIAVHILSVRRDNAIRRDTQQAEKQRREAERREARIEGVVSRYVSLLYDTQAGPHLDTVQAAGVRSLESNEEVREALNRIAKRERVDPMAWEDRALLADVNLLTVFAYAFDQRHSLSRDGALKDVLASMDQNGVDYHRR